jgi:hypothetical protein
MWKTDLISEFPHLLNRRERAQVSGWGRASTAQFERDLGNGRPHSGSLDFADTEEAIGSNHVAPTS